MFNFSTMQNNILKGRAIKAARKKNNKLLVLLRNFESMPSGNDDGALYENL